MLCLGTQWDFPKLLSHYQSREHRRVEGAGGGLVAQPWDHFPVVSIQWETKPAFSKRWEQK